MIRPTNNNLPSLPLGDFLDHERASSMADEGGFSAATLESPEIYPVYDYNSSLAAKENGNFFYKWRYGFLIAAGIGGVLLGRRYGKKSS